MTALERDSLWLFDNGYFEIDAASFCDWVCRMMNDGMLEKNAREFVLNSVFNVGSTEE
jgi:hypothetical protein